MTHFMAGQRHMSFGVDMIADAMMRAGEPVLKDRKRNRQSGVQAIALTGDNLNGDAQTGLWRKCLNTPHGYGVPIVVRDG